MKNSLIKIIHPREVKEWRKIVNYLKKNKKVIVNFKYLEQETAKKLMDYIVGTVFAFSGKFKKIGPATFEFVI